MVSKSKPKGDHKRKAVDIAPATVTVRDGEIIVVVPDVLGKNESHKNGKGGQRFTSESTDAYRESVLSGAAALPPAVVGKWYASSRDGCFAGQGAWRLEVVGVWPRQRGKIKGKKVDFVMPCGDADAAIPQALDALQHAGILDDDARVVEVRAWNLYRKGVRATVMRLVRLEPVLKKFDPSGNLVPVMSSLLLSRDESIAHLIPLIPPVVEPPPKPARSRRMAIGLPRCPECGGSHSSQTVDPRGFGCGEKEP